MVIRNARRGRRSTPISEYIPSGTGPCRSSPVAPRLSRCSGGPMAPKTGRWSLPTAGRWLARPLISLPSVPETSARNVNSCIRTRVISPWPAAKRSIRPSMLILEECKGSKSSCLVFQSRNPTLRSKPSTQALPLSLPSIWNRSVAACTSSRSDQLQAHSLRPSP